MLKRNMECWQFLADSDRKESQNFSREARVGGDFFMEQSDVLGFFIGSDSCNLVTFLYISCILI